MNALWNTTNPDFTECFQKTVLSWVPSGLLWLMSPVEIYLLSQSKDGHIPWTILNMAKTVSIHILSYIVANSELKLSKSTTNFAALSIHL